MNKLKNKLTELLDRTSRELTDLMPEMFCQESYLECDLDSFTYEITFDRAKDLGILPSTFTLDIGDAIITLYANGGHSGGTLLEVKITNPMDIEISLEDRDLILTKLKDYVTLREFIRASYTFVWKAERNHYLRVIGATRKDTTIAKLMKNFLSIKVVPERDIIVIIKKHFDVLDSVRYEVGIIQVPLDVRINETPENMALIDVLDAFKFAFSPLFKS